jgi:hypothetical protein
VCVALRLYPQLAINLRFANKTTVLPRGGGPDGQSPGEGVSYFFLALSILSLSNDSIAMCYGPGTNRWPLAGHVIR